MTSSRRYSSSVTTILEKPQSAVPVSLKTTTTSSPTPITEFHLFSALPPEIRLLIWRLSLPGPRIVLLEARLKPSYTRYVYRIRSDCATCTPSLFFNGTLDYLSPLTLRSLITNHLIGPVERGHDVYFRSCIPKPIILDVCSESRTEASRFYERAFGTTTGAPSIWFDYEVDELFVDWGDGRIMLDYRVEAFAVRDLERVRNLVLYERESRLVAEGYTRERWVAEVLGAFTGVRKVTRSVFGGDCGHDGGEVVWKELIPREIQVYWLINKINPTDQVDFLEALDAGTLTSVPLDMGKLGREMDGPAEKTRGVRGGSGVVVLPRIEYKIAMSAKLRGQLEEGERLYWEGVGRGEIRPKRVRLELDDD